MTQIDPSNYKLESFLSELRFSEFVMLHDSLDREFGVDILNEQLLLTNYPNEGS